MAIKPTKKYISYTNTSDSVFCEGRLRGQKDIQIAWGLKLNRRKDFEGNKSAYIAWFIIRKQDYICAPRRSWKMWQDESSKRYFSKKA